MLYAIVINMLVLFCYCYFGQSATESFERMADCIYNDLKWPELPAPLQKHTILMIANMQQTIYYHGLRVITLDLNTFIHVSSNSLKVYCMNLFNF